MAKLLQPLLLLVPSSLSPTAKQQKNYQKERRGHHQLLMASKNDSFTGTKDVADKFSGGVEKVGDDDQFASSKMPQMPLAPMEMMPPMPIVGGGSENGPKVTTRRGAEEEEEEAKESNWPLLGGHSICSTSSSCQQKSSSSNSRTMLFPFWPSANSMLLVLAALSYVALAMMSTGAEGYNMDRLYNNELREAQKLAMLRQFQSADELWRSTNKKSPEFTPSKLNKFAGNGGRNCFFTPIQCMLQHDVNKLRRMVDPVDIGQVP